MTGGARIRRAAGAATCSAALACALAAGPCPALAEDSGSAAVTVVAAGWGKEAPQKTVEAAVTQESAPLAPALARTGDAVAAEAALAGICAACAGLAALCARKEI